MHDHRHDNRESKWTVAIILLFVAAIVATVEMTKEAEPNADDPPREGST